MSVWNFVGLILAALLVVPLGFYYAARLVFTAWFFTKEQFEKRKHHGTR